MLTMCKILHLLLQPSVTTFGTRYTKGWRLLGVFMLIPLSNVLYMYTSFSVSSEAPLLEPLSNVYQML